MTETITNDVRPEGMPEKPDVQHAPRNQDAQVYLHQAPHEVTVWFDTLGDEIRSDEGRCALSGLRDHIEKLEALAVTDPLTELGNRRAFDENVERWHGIVNNQGNQRVGDVLQPEGLILLCDADHFKRVNDILGYDQGDRTLQILGGLLQASVRKNDDDVCRLGGDEFSIIAPVKQGEGEKVQEIIKKRFYDFLIDAVDTEGITPLDKEALGFIGVSFGYGIFQRGDSLEAIKATVKVTMDRMKEEKARKKTKTQAFDDSRR